MLTLIKEYKEYILSQSSNNPNITFKEEENKIELETEYGLGAVTIYEGCIIELSVTNKINQNTEFYLHFKFNTLEHAKELFNEMLEALSKLVVKPVTKVLFSCTSGLTTGFFAEKLNEAIQLLDLNYTVNAVAYNDLFDEGRKYDVIYLAPQVSYMEEKLKDVLDNENIHVIPAQIFAKYDTKAMIELLEENACVSNKKEEVEIESRREVKPHKGKILTINIIRNSFRVHMIYNVYNNENHHEETRDIIKPTLALTDIYDLIDTILYKYDDIECIGFTLPGIINQNGFISSVFINGLNNQSLEELFDSKYQSIKFVYINDVNAAAVGYYACNENYETVSYIFQPVYFRGGAGSVINGKVLKGAHNIAGEIKFAPINLSKEYSECHKTPEATLERVAKLIVILCSTIDPEAIGITCDLITSVDELRKEISKYMPSEYIPVLTLEDHMHLYCEFGGLILCTNALEEMNHEGNNS